MRRLSEVLLPESYSVARPAHSLLQIAPLLDDVPLHPLSAFSLSDPFVHRSGNEQFSFYPVCSSVLRRASVRSLIIGGVFYEVLPDLSKKLVARTPPSLDRGGRVFVGIDFEGDSFDLQSLSLYVDFPNTDQRRLYLTLLSHCKWFYGERSLAVTCGLPCGKNPHRDELLYHPDISEDVDGCVREHYKCNFVTFQDECRLDRDDMSLLPHGVKEEDFRDNVENRLLWLEVLFPSSFPEAVLNDLQLLLNVVPVVNKELHQEVATVKRSFGVVPLPLSDRESFLCVERVEDETGRRYRRGGWADDGSDTGCYALRKGGCEAFDRRDAHDYLLRLQHLLEDEMAMFSSSELGKNSEYRYLIENLVAKIGRAFKRRGGGGEPLHYLILDPPKDNALLYADYWTTFGASANGVRAGAKLNPPADLYGVVEHAQLVASSSGGAGLPTEQERIERFKYLLTSRDRIVTNADIEGFCRAELADCLSDVYLESGLSPGRRPGDGLRRTTDVHLVLKGTSDDVNRELMSERIYEGLVARSPMTFNYRVIID